MPENPLGYQDSLSRCDTYSNPYDYRSHPDFETARRRLLERRLEAAQDKMETEQQRMERRLIEQFQQSQFMLPGEKLFIVAQLGKYLFLAFTLPPYIFLYGMPKWLIENAMMPAVKHMMRGVNKAQKTVEAALQQVVQQLQHVQNYFKRAAEKVANVVLYPQTLILKFTQKIVEKWKEIKKLTQNIGEGEEKFAKEVEKGTRNEVATPTTKDLPKEPTRLEKAVLFIAMVAQLPKIMKQVLIERPLQMIQRMAQNLVNTVKERLTAFKEVVDVREPIKKWVQAQVQLLKSKIEPLYQVPINVASKLYEKTIEQVKHVIHRVTEPIQAQYETVKEKAKAVVAGVQRVSEKIQDKVRQVIDQYPVQYWNKTKEQVQNVREGVVANFEKVQEKVKQIKQFFVETVKSSVEVVKQLVQWSSEVAVPWVIGQLTLPLTLTSGIVFGGMNVIQFVAHKIRYKAEQLIQKVKFFMNSAWSRAKKAVQFIKSRSKALYKKYIVPVISKMTVANLLFCLRWILAWIKILLKLGWMMMTDLFNEAVSIRKSVNANKLR